MKICLIDADSKIPNLALMKLSAYYKNKGVSVDLIQLHLSYFPNRKKQIFYTPIGYDLYFCSCIFKGNKKYIQGINKIEFGGTGCDIYTKLPSDIEKTSPDYSIYPDNDISYGFISRGCIRKCEYCIVFEKEGGIQQVNNISEIVRHKKVKFLDNNILALPNHKELLQELVDTKIKCQFNQGLDIRLVDKENSILLSKLNYLGNYYFSFDDYSYLSIIEKKLKLLNWKKLHQIRFYIYCHPNMKLSNIVQRIKWIQDNNCLCYLMRDVTCWQSKYKDFYTDLAAYCNTVSVFKKMSFLEHVKRRHKNKKRVVESIQLYKNSAKKIFL